MGNLIYESLNWWLLGLRRSEFFLRTATRRTWTVFPLALWFPANSAYSWDTAPLTEMSLNSLYMLSIWVLHLYLHTMPYVLMALWFFSKISETWRIWPLALLSLFYLLISYQKLDLANTSFLENTLMAKVYSSSPAARLHLRPVTRNCLMFITMDLSITCFTIY